MSIQFRSISNKNYSEENICSTPICHDLSQLYIHLPNMYAHLHFSELYEVDVLLRALYQMNMFDNTGKIK